jgi:hypothetical protein
MKITMNKSLDKLFFRRRTGSGTGNDIPSAARFIMRIAITSPICLMMTISAKALNTQSVTWKADSSAFPYGGEGGIRSYSEISNVKFS